MGKAKQNYGKEEEIERVQKKKMIRMEGVEEGAVWTKTKIKIGKQSGCKKRSR